MVRQDKKILVADASAAKRSQIKDILADLDPGIGVTETAAITDCFKKLRKPQFDMAFVGDLPNTNPNNLLSQLQGLNSDTLLVAVRDLITSDERSALQKSCLYDCITGPVGRRDLQRLVKRVRIQKDPLSVLVVDDTRVMRKVIMRVVNESQFPLAISEADSSEMAVSLCRSIPYHCIFMDLNMPGQNGLESASQIMKVQSRCQIILMSSTKESNALEAEAKSNGLASFLSKPFYPADVDRLLHDFLGLQQPNIQNSAFWDALAKAEAEAVAAEQPNCKTAGNSDDDYFMV